MTTGTVPPALGAIEHLERYPRGRQALAAGTHHPASFSFAVAFALRVVAATVITVSRGYIFPDEEGYVGFSGLAASGHLTPSVQYGYGETLFHEAASFMWPLTIIFRIFGAHIILAALWASVFGAVTAALTALLVSRVLTKSWAAVGGLAVAVFPSQILWSSVVLRESMVWAGLVAIAIGLFGLSRAIRWQSVVGAAALIGVAMIDIEYLRSWAFLAAAWAVGLSVWLYRPARPVVTRAICTGLLVLVPVFGGLGIAGVGYIHHNTSNLGYERTVLSAGAKSAFVHPKVVKVAKPARATTPTTAPVTVPAPPAALADGDLVVPKGLGNDLRALPTGLVAFALRPFPWQHGDGLSYDFAAVEEVLYYPLYVLALVGLVAYRRRRQIIAFPLMAILGITGVASEAEGNIGSAFRHRDQLLWAVMFLATLGAHHLYERWRGRKAGLEAPGVPEGQNPVPSLEDTQQPLLAPS
jgi:hypothetical protein